MNNKLNENDLKLMNNMLQEALADSDGADFISYLSAEVGKKCSLVLKQADIPSSIGWYHNQVVENQCDHNFYYGLHPRISSNIVVRGIENGSFQNASTLLNYMNQLTTENDESVFKLHKGQEHVVKELFAAALVKMSNNFGIAFSCSNFVEIKDIIENHLDESSLYVRFVMEDQKILFLGGISDKLAQFMDTFHIGYQFVNNELTLVENGIVLSNIYSDKELDLQSHIHLSRGSVYYSGVMPRTVGINHINDSYNDTIDTFQFIVERTTFATLDVLDNCEIIKHVLLEDYLETLKAFYLQEDKDQEYLLLDYQNQKELLENINAYLKKSANTHTIAVTGNIETSEKI